MLWRLVKGIAVAMIVIIMLIALLGAMTEGLEAVLSLWPWAILAVAWVLFLTVVPPWLSAWQVSRNDPSIKGELTHHLTEDGYHIRGSAVNVDVKWPGVLRLVETNEFFLVFWSKAGAYYLPKRVVPADTIQLLRDVFVRELGDRACVSAV
jgi:hypothetical protein